MSLKDAYQEKLEAKLKEWNAEIEKLEAKAAKAKADARINYNEKLEDVKRKREAAREKLSELKGAGENAWENLKAGVENAWQSLEDAVKSAKSHFK